MKLQHIAGLLFILISLTWGCNQNAAEETEVDSSEQVLEKEKAPSPENKELKPFEVEVPGAADASGGGTASGEPDQYGRIPGDEHYGHGHAPDNDQPGNQVAAPTGAPFATGAPATGAPAATGPDKFGRNPGDAHYGHDHE